jgi:uncharacterized protein YcfJ
MLMWVAKSVPTVHESNSMVLEEFTCTMKSASGEGRPATSWDRKLSPTTRSPQVNGSALNKLQPGVVGYEVGTRVTVGASVGGDVGTEDGMGVGTALGIGDGSDVGDGEGIDVGTGVGTIVGTFTRIRQQEHAHRQSEKYEWPLNLELRCSREIFTTQMLQPRKVKYSLLFNLPAKAATWE